MNTLIFTPFLCCVSSPPLSFIYSLLSCPLVLFCPLLLSCPLILSCPLTHSCLLILYSSECQCNKAGTMQCLKEDDNSQIPPVPAGTCSCLLNVTGELCDECGPGFLRFNPENDSPCQSMYVCTIVYIKHISIMHVHVHVYFTNMCITTMYMYMYKTYIYAYIRMYIHIYIHTYIHNYIHTYIITYIHTYINTYIHT